MIIIRSLIEMFCSNCGAQIGANPNFCSNCGKAMRSIVPATQPKPNSKGWWILLIVPLFLVGLVAWAVINSSSEQARLEKVYQKEPSLRPAPVKESSTGNVAHDRLMKL